MRAGSNWRHLNGLSLGMMGDPVRCLPKVVHPDVAALKLQHNRRSRTQPDGSDGQARLGNALGKMISLTEKGTVVNGVGDSPNQHDMLTGTQPDGEAFTDGMDHTCSNWTSNGERAAQVGHSDKQGGGNESWNSSHASRGCSQEDLVGTGGAGLYYCFAS